MDLVMLLTRKTMWNNMPAASANPGIWLAVLASRLKRAAPDVLLHWAQRHRMHNHLNLPLITLLS